MDKPLALVTAPFRGPGLERLRALCSDVILDPWIDHRPLRLYNSEQLAERIVAEGAELLVVESDSVKGPVLDLPLRAIGSCRGDPNNVDVPAATANGIPVLRAPGRNADAVAEITIGLLYAVNRGIVRADMDVREGQVWRDGTIPYQRFRAWELHGRTAGIVGLGAVGRATKWRFEGLGMKVITCDPFAPDATHSLDDLLAEADVVSMHAAVTPETEGLIGATQFAAMKEGAIYVNSARARRSTTSWVSTSRSTIRSARCRTSCSLRTSAARRGTPRRVTPTRSPPGWTSCSEAAGRRTWSTPRSWRADDRDHREPGTAGRGRHRGRDQRGPPLGRAGDAALGPGRGHGRQLRRPHARRQRRA